MIATAVVMLAALTACSGDDDDSGGTSGSAATTTTAAAGTSSEPSRASDSDGTSGAATTTESATPKGKGCTGPAPTIDKPANQGRIVDVDGDGRPDTAWLSSPGNGKREMGVVTAAGGGDKVQVDSASPVAFSLLVADADDKAPVELFLSDNRTVQLWAFADCKLQQVRDNRGQPYLFDLGFRGNGTGVGCVDADHDGHRDLVGLNVGNRTSTAVQWKRTIIERVALRAANGHSDGGRYTLPAEAAKVDLLYTVSCGNLDIKRDAIHQPE
jgi:hypothetical protein